jgi:hypothetical protein
MPATINFFDRSYQTEEVHSDELFGICDDGKLAFIDTSDEGHWNARVENKDKQPVNFVPVDHNIIVYDYDYNEVSMCDAMLYIPQHWLAFVELKTSPKRWISEAVSQLQSTISIFKRYHDSTMFTRRQAYASNRCRPQYHSSQRELLDKFRRETGFRLNICFTVDVV